MLLKKLVILPALVPFALIPVIKHSLKTTSLVQPKEEIKLTEQEDIPLWKKHLLKECKPFSSNSSETIFICQPSSWSDQNSFFFYAKFEYDENSKDIPSSVLFSLVQRLSYDSKEEALVIEYLGEKRAIISVFPEEFKRLGKNSIDPNQSCKLGEKKLSLQCQFSSEGNYFNIDF